jgi:O-antigen ligase
MEAVAKRSNFFSQPRNIILTILGITLLWMVFPGNPGTLTLLAVAVLFFIGLKKPVWAVAALLVAQLTITSFMISTPFGAISLRLLLLIVTSLVLYRAFVQRQVDLGPNARKLIIPMTILILISLVANLVGSGFEYAFKEFRNMFSGLLIIVLIAAVTRSLKDLKILCGVVFTVITASALIGLLQHFRVLGIEQATVTPGFLTVIMAGDARVPGMAETELELAYVLTAAILVALTVYLTKGVNSGQRKLVLFSMLLMVPTLYFTYTRSALFAVGLGLISLFLFFKTRIKGVIVLVILLLVIGLVETTGISGQYLSGRSESLQEGSTISRKIAWQAGIQIAMDYPILGIGGNQFKVVSPRYTTAVAPDLLEWEQEQYWNFSTLGSTQPHNDYLNVWLSYGTPALLVFLWLLNVILRSFLNSARNTKDRFIRGLAFGMAAALITYAINAFYHNMLMTLPLLWILAGFSLAVGKLVLKSKVKPALESKAKPAINEGTNT